MKIMIIQDRGCNTCEPHDQTATLGGFLPARAVNGLKNTAKIGCLVVIAVGLAACGSTPKRSAGPKAHINNKTKFSSKTFGVAASPRVSTSKRVRKGGGRRQIGKPYKIRGKWYYPKEDKKYNRVGKASWYGPNFHGRLTANGEIYDQYALSAAHPTFPLPSYARVTNRKNGNSVIVRVNDRGPYSSSRIIDLSSRAADLLDYKQAGIANVRVQYIGQAPLHGRDSSYLVASYRPGRGNSNGGRTLPRPGVGIIPGVMLASAGSAPVRPTRDPRPVAFSSQPVSLAFAAPIPKERPLYTGGTPFEFYPSPTAGAKPFNTRPSASLPDNLRKRLKNVLSRDQQSRRSITSAFIAEGRISAAFDAVNSVVVPAISHPSLLNHWKRMREKRPRG